jgi:hypothetical protein
VERSYPKFGVLPVLRSKTALGAGRLKTCLKCEKEAPDGAAFCTFCGTKLGAEKEVTSRSSTSKKAVPTKVGHGGRKAKPFKGAEIRPRKTCVIVDGSNVIWYGEKARLKNLQLLMRKLDEEGYRYSVFVDASVKYDLGDNERQVFQRMISDGIVQEVPAKTSADEWILEYATRHPECRILSNDTFQEWASKYAMIQDQERFIRFMIVDDEVMLPKKEAGPLPEDVDAVIYFGRIYASYEDWKYHCRGDPSELERNPEPAPTLLERVKKMARTKDGFYVDAYLLNEEVRSVALIGYGEDAEWLRNFKALESFEPEFFKGEVFIEKSVSIWGEGKSRPIPGIAVILRKRERPEKGGPIEEEVDSKLMKKALKILEIAKFPELIQTARNRQRLAKVLYERVLLPVPGSDAFSDEWGRVTAFAHPRKPWIA